MYKRGRFNTLSKLNKASAKRAALKKAADQVPAIKVLDNKINAVSKRDKPETKYFTQLLSFLISTNNVLQIRKLFDIPRGQGVNDRIGSKIQAMGLEYRYELFNTAPLAQPAFVRCMVICDKNPNGVQFTMDQLFDPAITPMMDITFRNRQYLQRFSIIHDKCYRIGALGTAAGDVTGANLPALITKIGSKKQNRRILYTAAGVTGGIAETTESAYYFVTWCSIDLQLQTTANFRLKFTDS